MPVDWTDSEDKKTVLFKGLYYCLIEPIGARFRDSSQSKPAFEIPIESAVKNFKFGLFVDKIGEPTYVRFEIPSLEKEEIPEEIRNFLPAELRAHERGVR